MRVQIIAVNRMKQGPELVLAKRYIERFDKTGGQVGIGPLDLLEVEPERSRQAKKIARHLEALGPGAVVCVLDQNGTRMSSEEFSKKIANWRDSGRGPAIFIIGGPDGYGQLKLPRIDFRLSLGAMVFPHMLARIILAEQLYRALSILAGTPYHRG